MSKTLIAKLPQRLATCAIGTLLLTACAIEPPLHLHEDLDLALPEIDLDIDVLWDYLISYDYEIYDYHNHWLYGWDDTDQQLFGDIGYHEPTAFNFYRYYTGWTAKGTHTHAPIKDLVYGRSFTGQYNYGYYDFLIFNEPGETDGAQNTHLEEVGNEYVRAFTNPSMNSTQHYGRVANAVNQPEELFSAYDTGIAVPDPRDNYELYGYVWHPERGKWVKTFASTLTPVTYIYLTQIILVNNKGRIDAIEGSANLTGMAYETNVNTHVTGTEPISVYYHNRLKRHSQTGTTLSGTFPNRFATFIGPTDSLTNKVIPTTYNAAPVDIIGGKVLTFGMCGLDPGAFDTRASYAESIQRIEEIDPSLHYIEVAFLFNNGQRQVYSFDVTDQVRTLFKGGVLTVVIDVDHLPIPDGPTTGSGFDATVEDWEQETHEIEM